MTNLIFKKKNVQTRTWNFSKCSRTFLGRRNNKIKSDECKMLAIWSVWKIDRQSLKAGRCWDWIRAYYAILTNYWSSFFHRSKEKYLNRCSNTISIWKIFVLEALFRVRILERIHKISQNLHILVRNCINLDMNRWSPKFEENPNLLVYRN